MATVRVTGTAQQITTSQPVVSYRLALMQSGVEVQTQTFPAFPVTHDFLNVPMGTGYTVQGRSLDAAGADVVLAIVSPAFDVTGVIVTVFGAISVQVIQG